jgi:hypothetical protein
MTDSNRPGSSANPVHSIQPSDPARPHFEACAVLASRLFASVNTALTNRQAFETDSAKASMGFVIPAWAEMTSDHP